MLIGDTLAHHVSSASGGQAASQRKDLAMICTRDSTTTVSGALTFGSGGGPERPGNCQTQEGVMPTENEIDTSNEFCVSACMDHHVLIPRPLPPRMTRAQALRLAAWLVALADDDDEFPAFLEAVQNT